MEQKTSSGLSKLQWNVPKLTLHNFNQINELVHQREDLRKTITNGGIEKTIATSRGTYDTEYSDFYDVINIHKGLKVIDANPEGYTINIVGQGNLLASKHAMSQLGSMMGVKLTKFFNNMPPDQINNIIEMHLKAQDKPIYRRVISRNHGEAKLQGKFTQAETKQDIISDSKTDGVLRGFVSPTYSEIKDVDVFSTLEIMGPALKEQYAIAACAFTDNDSHFTLVNREPKDLLSARSVAQLNLDNIGIGSPVGDAAFIGIRLRNSEVGFRSLTAQMYAIRFVCSNGMISGLKGDILVNKRHIGVTPGALYELVKHAFLQLPERERLVVNNTRLLHAKKIDKPEEEIVSFLEKEPKALKESVLEAYRVEAIATAYGVLQAIARVAMASRANPQRQYDLEVLAGQYMRKNLK